MADAGRRQDPALHEGPACGAIQRVHEAGLFKPATSALKPTHPQ